MQLNGKTVAIYRPTWTVANHEKVVSYSDTADEFVNNVLIAVGDTAARRDNDHPDGVTITYTLGFPKDYKGGSLRACVIELPAPWSEKGRVVGDPRPSDPDLTPTRWDMNVKLEAFDG